MARLYPNCCFMKSSGSLFRRGDLVEVRSVAEIMQTLDADGTLDGLPFMPEMVRFAGRRFRVSRRAEKTCVDRCDGSAHGGCGRSCSLFWKSAWIFSVTESAARSPDALSVDPSLVAGLQTRTGDGTYFCQSSRLLAATRPLSSRRRFQKCFQEVWVGNRSVLEMIWLIVSAAWRKFLQRYDIGVILVGAQKQTPTEALHLQPGDWVEVKSPGEIRATLDAHGRNRGMVFGMCMTPFCGRQYQVKSRLDHMIIETTGELRKLSNTVVLAGVVCRCPMVLGGCPRKDSLYWREIWLKRVDPSGTSPARNASGAT